jgi:hypothetical protein
MGSVAFTVQHQNRADTPQEQLHLAVKPAKKIRDRLQPIINGCIPGD